MPNDAKCGLVVGVGLVIAVAIVFFQRDSSPRPSAAIDPPAHAVQPAASEDPEEPAPRPEESQTGGVAVPAVPPIQSPSGSHDPWKRVK